MALRLVAGKVAGDRSEWLWRLFDQSGTLAVEHRVRVDTTLWEWQALFDLPVGVDQQVDPGNRFESEVALVGQVGRWTAEHVLGTITGALVDAAIVDAPVVVSVEVPAAEGWLLALPLGVAEVDGRSLATRGVVFAGTFHDDQRPTAKAEVGERLRMLAVFSVPAGQSLLDLRRERKGLTDLVQRMAGSSASANRAIDLRVLQYGATAQRLQDVLAESEGWDVVHFSGHGAAGRLVLEDEAGRAQVVDANDVVDWLQKAGNRLKLVSLSACSSAAFTVAETLQAMGVVDPDVAGSAERTSASSGLALEVVRRAECTVVAMRYPVADDFAIAFGLALFEGLWDQKTDVASAVGWAVQRAVKSPPTPGAPALSAFTPAVFGSGAADLRLLPPVATPGVPVSTSVPGFDVEPARFVGRIAVMTRANSALAPLSGHSGVVFHGMAGAGKTTCALELAYGQRANFVKHVWFTCPDEEGCDAIALEASLTDLARRLDQALGMGLADTVQDPGRLAGAMVRLTETMEGRTEPTLATTDGEGSVLVVLDNAESLLSTQGAWLDQRWAAMIAALSGHQGRGRLVLTSRRRPAQLPPGMMVEDIHALTRDEAVLLARQLPNLARLLDSQGSATNDGPSLARAVLEATGGHPKLLELADAHVAVAGVLDSMLAGATRVWSSAGIDSTRFLTRGSSRADPVASYVALVRTWAGQALEALDEEAALLAQVLCRCDPSDRTSRILDANWADVWHRLGRVDAVPARRVLVARLAAAALVEVHPPVPGRVETYDVHPLVADTICAVTSSAVTTAVDKELAAYWTASFDRAVAAEDGGLGARGVAVHAARQGVAYLIRLAEWDLAGTMVEQVIARDPSLAGRAEAVRLMRTIARQAAGTDGELPALGTLAGALAAAEPGEAEQLMRRVEAEATAGEKFRLASAVANDLVELLTRQGRHQEAREVSDRTIAHTARAGLGAWTQLADHIPRLRDLQFRGQNEQVLAEAARYRDEMAGLAAADDEPVASWNVREALFDIATWAAMDLERWDEVLDWHYESLASIRRRGASELEIAQVRRQAFAALLHTDLGEARAVLDACRVVFETYDAYESLARCLGDLAELEFRLGHRPQAINQQRIGLRYDYRQPDPESVARAHFNMANYLDHRTADTTQGLAHRLAATIIFSATGSDMYRRCQRSLVRDLGGGTVPPGDFDALCNAVEQVDGVRFAALVNDLGGSGDRLLAAVLNDALGMPGVEFPAARPD